MSATRLLTAMITQADRVLADFAKGLTGDDPFDAIVWRSSAAFSAAADRRVAAVLLDYAERGMVVDSLLRVATDRALSGAQALLNTSSSETTNVAQRAETAAWARVVASLEYLAG